MVASVEREGIELPALVVCDLLGTAETSNPDGDEGFSHCFGVDVRRRECLRPTGVSVGGSEIMLEARRERQRSLQVDMQREKRVDGRLKLPRGVSRAHTIVRVRV